MEEKLKILVAFLMGYILSIYMTIEPEPNWFAYISSHLKEFDKSSTVIMYDGAVTLTPTAFFFGYTDDLLMCEEFLELYLKEYPMRNKGYCEVIYEN